jgi:transposase-like protein
MEQVPNHGDPLPPVSQPLPKPRTRVCTGARLGNKVQLAEALLRSGASQSKVAKDLGISRHSVHGIAQRMTTGRQAAPSGTQPDFEAYVKGDLQRVARLTLGNITKEKVEGASLRDVAFTADKALSRLEAIDARSGNLSVFALVASQFDLTASHAASRLTIRETKEVEVTTERQ